MFGTEETVDPRISVWREILRSDDNKKSWVLLENGTCVILTEPEDDLAEQARQLLAEYGPVYVGTAAADFNVIELEEPLGGWVVSGHHSDVLNYLFPKDIHQASPSDMGVGLKGRSNRDLDGNSLKVVHVEDNRGSA